MNLTPSAPYPPPSCDGCHNLECHNLKCHNLESHNLECHNLESHNLECHNLESHNLECHNLECHNLESHNLESHNLESHNLGPKVPSYGISVPQSGASQDGWSSPNMTCPPGLEYLIALDYLDIQQQEEPMELISGCESENKYHVTKANGQRLYFIQEESNVCALLCLGPSRCCEFRVVDTSEREILHMVRPYRCSSCCCCCCTQVLEVYSRGLLLGTVIEHRSSFLKPSLSIRDASGKTVLRIKGPWIKCCGTAKFKIKSADDVHKVGKIKKEWGGFCKEAFTDADNFSLRFPIDLDVKIKAVLLGACILIDYLYFEECKSHGIFSIFNC